MNHSLPIAASLALGVVTLSAQSLQAATFNFSVENLTGDLAGETLSGSFQFDESGLTGAGDEFLPVSTFTFDFLGSEFTEADATSGPEAIFSDNQFLGLNYAAESINPPDEFTFISFAPGPDTVDESQFDYSTLNSGDGTGDILYSQVPEPNTILGSTAVLGLMLLLRKKLRQ